MRFYGLEVGLKVFRARLNLWFYKLEVDFWCDFDFQGLGFWLRNFKIHEVFSELDFCKNDIKIMRIDSKLRSKAPKMQFVFTKSVICARLPSWPKTISTSGCPAMFPSRNLSCWITKFEKSSKLMPKTTKSTRNVVFSSKIQFIRDWVSNQSA